MKRKNASISNADILYNYVHNNCPRRFFIDFYGVSSILSTLFMLCGQIVDKLSSVDKFIIFSIFNNPLFYTGSRAYLPQHCLYFLPLPHGHGSFLPTFLSLITVPDIFCSLYNSDLLSFVSNVSQAGNSYNQSALAATIL